LHLYINFYDRLIRATSIYLSGIENLSNKYSYLAESVNDYKKDLYATLGAPESNLLVSFMKVLPDPSAQGINFRKLISSPVIAESRNLAWEFNWLLQLVCTFKMEYNILLVRFLEDYCDILSSTKNFPEGKIDHEKTDKLIRDIEAFISGLDLPAIKYPDNLKLNHQSLK
jgi:hypothetical protein